MASFSVVDVSKNFISHFSQESGGLGLNPPWHPLVDESTIPALQEEAAASREFLETPETAKKTSGFYFLARGSHNRVLGHDLHPRSVFKFMAHKDAEHQHLICKKTHTFITAQQGKFWVRAPVSQVIELPHDPTHALYVEERFLLGMDMRQHEEFWARIFVHYESSESSPAFKENLHTLVNNIAALIENLGFWDVGMHNLPEVSLDGSCVHVVDFENIPVEPRIDEMADGFSRLIDLFCLPELNSSILQKYRDLGCDRAFLSFRMKSYQHLIETMPQTTVKCPTLEEVTQQNAEHREEKRQATRSLMGKVQASADADLKKPKEKGFIQLYIDPIIGSCQQLQTAPALLGACTAFTSLEEPIDLPSLTLAILFDTCQGHVPTLYRERFQGLEESCYSHAEMLNALYNAVPSVRSEIVSTIESRVAKKFKTPLSGDPFRRAMRSRLFCDGYELITVQFRDSATRVDLFSGVEDALAGNFGETHQVGETSFYIPRRQWIPDVPIDRNLLQEGVIGDAARERFSRLRSEVEEELHAAN